MSNQVRGFSGVGQLSSSKDALIPPQILAQTPNWNPLKQNADEAKQSQWQKMREQVSMDSWVERQDDHTGQKINRLEQQFAARVNSGQSQSTDQELFPDRHFEPTRSQRTAAPEDDDDAQVAAPRHSHHHHSRHGFHHKSKGEDAGSEINWSMWAAAVCLFLVGVGSLGMWLFTGQPDFGSMFGGDSSSQTTAAADPNASAKDKEQDGAQNTPANASGNAATTATAMQDNSAAASAMALFDDEGDGDAAGTAGAAGAGAFGPQVVTAPPISADTVLDITKGTNAAARAEIMSDFLFNQDPQVAAAEAAAAEAAAANQVAPDKILLTPISAVSPDTILTASLPALPKLKRPDPKAVNQALSPEEYRWCALIQMGTTEVAQPPEVCSSPEVIRYGQDIMPFLSYFKVLGLYRAMVEQKRDPQTLGVSLDPLEIEQWMQYKLTSEGDELNERDTHHCGQSWVVINGYFALSQFGFNPAVLNEQIQHFNDVCGKKVVPIAQQKQWMERNDMMVYLQSMLIVNFAKLTSDWVNYTFLPPVRSTPQEMAPEISEAQQRLQQLGYVVPLVSGKMDSETREAVKQFEQDMGLNATGDLTFSILLRLRLATQGYDSKQAWLTPLK